MILSAIVAVAANHAIGRDNQMPWHLPDDLKFFKRTTMGKPVLMGRKTFQSLGRPLPGRLNIVVSRQPSLSLPEGVLLFNDIDQAVEYLTSLPVEEAFIIGGGDIFRKTLPLIQRVYLTRIHADIPDADVFFPALDPALWKQVWEEHHDPDARHAYPFTFQQYERML